MANVYSVNLDGNDAFSAVDHADFKPSGAFVVGFWLKTTVTGYQTLFYTGPDHASDLVRGLWLDTGAGGSGKVRVTLGNGSTADGAAYDSSINDGNWHWLVASYTGTVLHIYLDTVEFGTGQTLSAVSFSGTNYVRVGCMFSSGGNVNFTTGNFDEFFMITGSSWTQTDVNNYYQLYITGATNLKAYYQYENNALDSTVNDHDLTDIGDPAYQTDVPFVNGEPTGGTNSRKTLLGVGL